MSRYNRSDQTEELGGSVGTAMRIPRYAQALAAGLLLSGNAGSSTGAEPPAVGAAGGAAAGTASSDAQATGVKGDFFSSLKQAFKQNADREVVRGHFDVGSPPNTHRFYCLVDPKTGKREPNGVGGEPVVRPDGMTGLKASGVAPLSCADAEQKGILVTSGYIVKGSAVSSSSATAPRQNSAASAAVAASAASAVPAAGAVSAAGAVPAASAAPAVSAAPAASAVTAAAAGSAASANATVESSTQTEVMAVYNRFIAAQNAHDRAAVSEVLLDSKDFVWAQSGGNSVWGHKEAMEALEQQWKGTWRLDPQPQEVRVASLSSDVAVLITPLVFTSGLPGEDPSLVPIRWAGVFVKTKSGWRITSIFITPFKGWHAPTSN